MGNVSDKVCFAAISLGSRIKDAYGYIPQGIIIDGGIGFNVGGREVGRVIDRNDRGIDVLFYAPGDERYEPVFGEKFE